MVLLLLLLLLGSIFMFLFFGWVGWEVVFVVVVILGGKGVVLSLSLLFSLCRAGELCVTDKSLPQT